MDHRPKSYSTVIARRYGAIKVLGQGTFGEVYLVEDLLHGHQLALKIRRLGSTDSDAFQERFLREIQVLRRLHHPGIPAIYNDGRADIGGVLLTYFTMQYVEGVTLREEMDRLTARGERMDWERIQRLLVRTLEILDHAHSRGVVHRDLKPDNMMLVQVGTPDEDVRVLDFGLAKVLANDAPDPNSIPAWGTVSYMAPEQVQQRDVDGRTDLYALAVIVYQLCSGRLPIEGDTPIALAMAKLASDPAPLTEEEAPDWLRRLLLDLLHRELADRPGLTEILYRLSALDELPIPRI